MKLDKISLTNFRGISSCTFDLTGKTTVFFGINGAGKTSILNAINLIYSNVIKRIINNRFKQGINFEVSDISFGVGSCNVMANFAMDDGSFFEYSRGMERKAKKRTHTLKELQTLTDYFRQTYLPENGYADMPIFVNYGVNRLVIDIPLRIRNSHSFDQTSAFEKAIESRIDFRTFFEWFRNQEDIENQIIVNDDDQYADISLSAVRNAAVAMFDDFRNLRVTRNPLAMKVDKGSKSLSINQLSDGEKCTMAMIGDLARRLALANPKSDNPLLGTGVVLIDEIELHMHPAWQRKIIPFLRKMFPNIQFIITTHSPQVLGEIKEDINLFSLDRQNGDLVITEYASMIGWDTNTILEDYMHVGSVNNETKKMIQRIYQKIDDNKYEAAAKEIDRLRKITSDLQQDVVRAQMLIDIGMGIHAKNKKK